MPNSVASVMIDPSLIVAKWRIRDTFEKAAELKRSESYQFFAPKSFLDFVESRFKFEESPLISFFSQGSRLTETNNFRRLFAEHKGLLTPFAIGDYHHTYQEFRQFLAKQLTERERKEEYLLNTLLEEWAFLVERSWIVSRIKRPFTRFADAGAAYLSLGRNVTGRTVDTATRKTLKVKDEHLVTKVDRLRALGKWIAVSGDPLIAYYLPVLGLFSGIVTGFFLLFDP